jgi:SAM-dependent MidA family methyltransferase
MTQENSGTAGFDTTPSPEASVNGTGQLAPQPEAATGLAPVSPEGTAEQQPSYETMQAHIEELEAVNAKQANDYKAMQGRIKSQQGDDSRFDQLSESVMMINDTMAALLRHQGTDDPETFREDLQKIDTEAQTRKQTSTFQRTSQLMIDEINQTVKDSGLVLESAGELAEFRELWGPSYKSKDIAGLYQAQAVFNRAMRQVDVRRREETELAHKEAIQKTLEEHGVNTLDLDSSASAPASMSSNNLLSRLGNSEMAVSRDEIKQAAEVLRKQGIRI